MRVLVIVLCMFISSANAEQIENKIIPGLSLLSHFPSKSLQVMKLSENKTTTKEQYRLFYGCRCGGNAIEINKQSASLTVYNICSAFDKSDPSQYSQYQIRSINKQEDKLIIDTISRNKKSTQHFEFTLNHSGIMTSNIEYEAIGWQGEFGPAYFIDVEQQSHYQVEHAECGDYDG